jgi:hypothetical protein
MSKLPKELQHLTDELPANKRADVEAAILSSPFLLRRLAEESGVNRLEHIRLQQSGEHSGEHSGGHFDKDEKAIYLNPDIFTEYAKKSATLDRITYVLGHEVGHSGMSPSREIALDDFSKAARNAFWTESEHPVIDLTDAAERYLQGARRDESLATISAINALADRVDQERPGTLTRDDLLRRVEAVGSCVTKVGDDYILAPGITLNQDQRIIIGTPSATSPNMEAVGRCYYDASIGLGRHGDSDYTHFYGKTVIETIASSSRHFERTTGQEAVLISLDFERLGLDRQQLERNGLNLGGENFALVDRGPNNARNLVLKHDPTAVSPDSPIQLTYGRAYGNDAPVADALRVPDITDRNHPGHARYQQALDAIERSPNIPPGTFTGERLQQAAANLAYASLAGADRPQGGQNERLDRIDFVVFNKDRSGLIAGQGEMGHPTSKMALLPAAQDNATTLTQASQQVRDTMAQQQQQAQQWAQQPPAQTQDDQAPKGPRL